MLLPVMESSRFGDHAEAGEDHADGAGVQEELAMQQQGGGAGGAIRDKPVKVIPCPRCQSMNTKFCYYNNYSVTQPRHFCRNCQRYWTVGGTLRNVPVGGGSRKKTRTRSRSDPYHVPAYDNAGGATTGAPPQSDSFLSGMQHLSMLAPPSLGFMNFPTSAPFLLDGLYNPRQKPLAGLQEVPDMQSLFDQAPQVPQIPPVAPPMLLNNMNFFHAPQQQAAFQPQASEPLASMMAKAGLWSQTPTVESPSWEMDPQKKTSALHGVGGYGHLLAESLKQQPGFWPAGCVADDRLVPHASWDDSNPSTTHNTPNLSPNGSSTTDSMANPGRSTTFYYEDVSQPWAGILNGF